MHVLALEFDQAQAAAIRHVVCDLVQAELTLVDSIEHTLQALHTERPDLILVPALLSPTDEALLLASLRTSPERAHIETLITPVLNVRGEPSMKTHGWRPWGSRRTSSNLPKPDDARLFAERLAWSLQRVRGEHELPGESDRAWADTPGASRFEPVAPSDVLIAADPLLDEFEEGKDSRLTTTTESAPGLVDGLHADRRASRRFAAHELQGFRVARIRFGPVVTLLDLSTGGVQFETQVRLQPEAEALLELVGKAQSTTVPFRVLRCEIAALSTRPVYRGAGAFTRHLDLADLVAPSPVTTETEALTPPPERTALVATTSDVSSSRAVAYLNRRRHVRVDGPFDGQRRGFLDTPIRIGNLSEGGCFVNSLIDEEIGRHLTLVICLPSEPPVAVQAEVVHGQSGLGFAVRFVDLPDATHASLARLVASSRRTT